MFIGIIIILILSYFLVAEITIIYHKNPVRMNKKRKEEEVEPESRLCGTRALTLAGLTFAAIIFLFGNFNKAYDNTLLIMTYSFGLLLLSYNFEMFTGLKEIYFIAQDRLLMYGFLGLIIALSVLFWEKLRTISIIILIFLIIFLILHIGGVKIDLQTYEDMQ